MFIVGPSSSLHGRRGWTGRGWCFTCPLPDFSARLPESLPEILARENTTHTSALEHWDLLHAVRGPLHGHSVLGLMLGAAAQQQDTSSVLVAV